MGPKPNSWEMEKGTKEYYLKQAEETMLRNRLLRSKQPKPFKIVGKTLLEQQEYLHRLRFAALAHMEDDIGLEEDKFDQDPEWKQIEVKKREYYLPINKNRVIYMDKIQGNSAIKNWHFDEESTFKPRPRRVERPPPRVLKAVQDSKRRHQYAGT